jgi:hypothetical protein
MTKSEFERQCAMFAEHYDTPLYCHNCNGTRNISFLKWCLTVGVWVLSKTSKGIRN